MSLVLCNASPKPNLVSRAPNPAFFKPALNPSVKAPNVPVVSSIVFSFFVINIKRHHFLDAFVTYVGTLICLFLDASSLTAPLVQLSSFGFLVSALYQSFNL
jgi:hypothetical protein